MNWDTININLGTQFVNQRVEVTFTYLGLNPELITQANIKASCGCSVPIWNADSKQLKVIYLPNPIPAHMALKGDTQYNSSKHIDVTYGGRTERLTFTALIRRR